jgi:hypothetical protein
MTSTPARRALAGLAAFLCAVAAVADPPQRVEGFAPTPNVNALDGFWLGCHTPDEPGEDDFRQLAGRMQAVIERVKQMEIAR